MLNVINILQKWIYIQQIISTSGLFLDYFWILVYPQYTANYSMLQNATCITQSKYFKLCSSV